MQLDISYKGIRSLQEYFETYKGNIDEIEELLCYDNQLTSLQGCPPNLKKLWCIANQLTSLEGCPPNLKEFWCDYNQLTSLEGCPPNLKKLSCEYNQLTSLEGCPPNLEILWCDNNKLTSLEGCPHNLEALDYYSNPLSPEWSDLSREQLMEKLRIKSFLRGIQKVNTVTDWKWRLVRRFCNNLLEKWYAPDENGVAPYALWTFKKFQQECAV